MSSEKKPLCTIIGLGPGVSFSVAKKFAQEGFEVATISRDKNKQEQFKNKMAEAGFKIHPFTADVADFQQLKQALHEIKNQLGDTEVLVYNVSVYREATPTQLDPEVLVNDFRANVAGAVVAVQQVADAMKANKRGTIIITGGGSALRPIPVLSSLAIGKAGIRNLSYSLHDELKPFGIRVGTITINGQVLPNTRFAPDLICETFWQLYSQTDGGFQKEIVFE